MGQKQVYEESSISMKLRKTGDFYTQRAAEWWRDLVWPLAKPVFDRPVFVIGCSRAGTTAVYKVLSMASELASMQKESHEFWDELHPLQERNWDSHILTAEDADARARAEVSRFFYRHLGSRRFLDKANQNCFRIPYLHAIFPDAFFVYVRRDGRDNINSLIHGWGRPEQFGGWSGNLPAEVRIDGGKYTRWCFFLFPGWRDLVNAPVETVCARQWVEANEAVLSAREAVPPGQWVDLVYEDMLKVPVETFERVFAQLGISFTDEIRSHCDDLAAKPYNAFSAPRLEKWKEENRERIERVIPVIAGMMGRLGYETGER
jgi:hypothetical protein